MFYKKKIAVLGLLLIFQILNVSRAEILFQNTSTLNKNEKIAFWAEHFIGIKYDTEPVGNYVKNGTIVDDTALDCMSHTFRSFELAFAETNEQAIENALFFRFPKKGEREGNFIKSYADRFQYGEDMVFSGKFGKVVSNQIGKTEVLQGTKRTKNIEILPQANALLNISKFKTGDVIFLIKNESKRGLDEIVGHIGILKIENGEPFLIHASGSKSKGGIVKKVSFSAYMKENYPFFIGIIVTRI